MRERAEGDEWREWGEVGRRGRWREVGDDVSVSPRDRGVTMLDLDPRRDREGVGGMVCMSDDRVWMEQWVVHSLFHRP